VGKTYEKTNPHERDQKCTQNFRISYQMDFLSSCVTIGSQERL